MTERESDIAWIQGMIEGQVQAWNNGDGVAYAALFAEDGTFTNLIGTVAFGRAAFELRHVEIFATFFRGTTIAVYVRRLHFISSNVALVDLDTEVRGVGRMPLGVHVSNEGVLKTRLLQVLVRRENGWRIAAHHNVDVKPGFE